MDLEQLHEQYRPALHALARRWVKDADLREDLVQESLLLSWKKKLSFSDPRAFLAWSRETLRYLAFARNRASRRPLAPPPSPAAPDPAEEVLSCAFRVARLCPDENPRLLAAFLMHSVFQVGVRYLGYVLEVPKSTVARKFEALRDRMAAAPWDAPAPEAHAVRVVEELSFGLVRERLMAVECRSAKETCGFANELLWKALARVPSAQPRLLCGIVQNISYSFRRCPPDPVLEDERARLRGLLDDLTAGDERGRSMRMGSEYMVLRSTPDAPREAWVELLPRCAERPPWPGMVTAIEQAHGWEQARSYLLGHFRRSEIDHSFYLSYLAASYALRRGEPRVAHRHLTQIREFYCPEYFQEHVDGLREACVAAWHDGGVPIREPSRLLA
jgi:DNA-directed RNA polymerase specialized sigma24 family protein